MNNNRKKGFLFLLFPILLFAITFVVMYLWNAILPEVIGVKSITFWQAMGILVLSKILFGGFHGKFGRGRCGEDFKERMLERKMEGMTDEEREKFKEKLKEKFGSNPFCKR